MIIVADDDFDVRIALGDRLRKMGYTVMTAHSARQALELVVECRGESVTGIILDLEMVEREPLDALGQLRNYDPSIPIVVTTEAGDPRTIARAKQHGARDALLKPIDLEALKQTCRRWFHRA